MLNFQRFLVAGFFILTFIPLVFIEWSSRNTIENVIEDNIQNRLDSLASYKAQIIEDGIKEKKERLKSFSREVFVSQALDELNESYKKDGIESDSYNAVYDKHYYIFYEYLNLDNHYDVFLVNTDGDIIFTVIKEPDFGTNLITGPYKNSGLAKTVVQTMETNQMTLSGLDPYDVAGGLHSQFLAMPVLDKRQVIGFLAIQIDTHNINKVASKYIGLGQTGESVFIKPNGDNVEIMNVMRGKSDPPFSISLGKTDLGANLYHSALTKASGFIVTKDIDGQEVYARWQNIRGTDWVIVVKMNVDEIQADFSSFRNHVIGTFILVSLFVFVMGYIFSRLVSSPIEKIAKRARLIADGDLSTRFERSRWYEINQLSNALSSLIAKQTQSIDRLNEDVRLRGIVSDVSNTINSNLESQLKAPEVMQKIAQSTGAKVAALYASVESEFVFHSGYGICDDEALDARISQSDGIYSQAVVTKEPIWLNHENQFALNIKSSLYAAKSAKTLIYPVLNGDELVAVLELGWDEIDTGSTEEILNQISKTFSMAIIASQQKELVESMLEQSIKQSQELLEQKESLEEANNELMEKGVKINKTLKEVEKKSKEVEKANRYKSEFLANMSHELRTPLNSMLILAHSLVENHEGNLSEDDVEAAEVIHSSGKQLLALINDILDLSKVESGKMEISEIEVDLSTMAKNFNRRFDKMFAERGNTLSFTVSPDLPSPVLLDDTKVNQMLTNLLSNANKFTKDGSIHVDFNRVDESMMAIAVSDTGIGIPEKKQDVIFDAFKQADGSTSRSYGGTGLGLSIVKKYAELMSGQLLLESKEGEGSTFTLILPLKAALQTTESKEAQTSNSKLNRRPYSTSNTADSSAIQSAPESKDDSSNQVNLSDTQYVHRLDDDRHQLDVEKKTVLIVEDDPVFAKILSDVVSAQGCNVLIEHDGFSAVRTIENFELDGIILDYMLPHLNGQEIINRVKSTLERTHTPVHIISALDLTDEQTQGAINSTVKPVSSQELSDIVNALVNTSLAEAQILIVEDNQHAFDAICRGIGVKPEAILQARSGQEATDILQSHKPQCIILDLGLPDCYGVDLLKDLDRICDGDLPQIMIYSAGEISEQNIESIKFYTDTIITKSGINFDELLTAVEGFVNKLPAEYMIDNLPDDTLVPGALNALPDITSAVESLAETKAPQKYSRRATDKKTPEPRLDSVSLQADSEHSLGSASQLGSANLGHSAEVSAVEANTTQDKVSSSALSRFNKEDIKLLLVDDQMINTFALAKVLRKHGVNVEIAPGGKEALNKLFEIRSFDIVLMDVMMPDMDGYEATREIRKHEAFADLPVIAVTAKAMKGDREKCLEAGMNDFVSKPVDMDELIQCVNKWVTS